MRKYLRFLPLFLLLSLGLTGCNGGGETAADSFTLNIACESEGIYQIFYTFYLDGEELDVEALQNALTALTADSFTNETPSGDEEIRLTLTLDNENYPTMTLAFYRYNGTLCLAEADGAPVCLVSRSAVVDLVEAVQAFALNE